MALEIGFTKFYYTLWDITSTEEFRIDIDDKPVKYGRTWKYLYKQNLSFDREKAIEKAKAKGCTNLVPNESLRGFTRSFTRFEKIVVPEIEYESHQFPSGKYRGLDIRDCMFIGYLKYLYFSDYCDTDERRKIVMNRIVELNPDWWSVYDNNLISKPELEKMGAKVIQEKEIEKNGYFEVLNEKNCDGMGRLNVGVDLKFENVSSNFYGGFMYYLPVFDSKSIRIKNKNLRIYIDGKLGDGSYKVGGVQVLKKNIPKSLVV